MSVYEKLVNSQKTHDDPSVKENKNKNERTEEKEPDYFDKTGLEPMFTTVDPELAYSDEGFTTKSSQLSREEKTSEASKLGIDTRGMADTLNEGEREKDFVKQNMGVLQKNKK